VIDIDQRSAGWHATGRDAAIMTGDTGQEAKDIHEVITEPGAVVKTGDATAADLLIGARAEEGQELR
jgi:hypothetical protein